MYQYKCAIVKVVDGDTLHVEIDLGLNITTYQTIRLWGVNTPEMSTAEGPVAKQFVIDWIKDKKLILTTLKDKREKYGRYLGILLDLEGRSLNDALVEAGLADIYYG